jgi:hypothetical protein
MLAGTDGNEVRIERVAAWDGMPTGPVDALAAAGDTSVFLAYNALNAALFGDRELAERRARTRIWHVTGAGQPREVPVSEENRATFEKSQVRALAFSPRNGLWVGTSAGLFLSANGDTDPLKLVTAEGRLPPVPIRHVVVAPDEFGTVWMARDALEGTPPLVIGYRPGTEWTYFLDNERGVPKGPAIDDLALTEDGELVVLVGSRLAKGHAFVPVSPASFPWALLAAALLSVAGLIGVASLRWNPRVNRLRANPEQLRATPLESLPRTLRSLRLAGALKEVWGVLGLPLQRLPMVRALASRPHSASQLQALAALLGAPAPETRAVRTFSAMIMRLAKLLGVPDTAAGDVRQLKPGLWLLPVTLPYAKPLGHRTIGLVEMGDEVRQVETAEVRLLLESTLEQAGQPIDLPCIVWTNLAEPHDYLPRKFRSLCLSKADMMTLLFATNPLHSLAGLLFTHGLFALSPYRTAGPVMDDRMFFGRERLVNEMLQTRSVQFLLVGGRRVGKSSLLRRLEQEVRDRRPDMETVSLNLQGITDHAGALHQLTLELRAAASGAEDPAKAFAALLDRRFREANRKGFVLIDEADGLVKVDEAAGFPLLLAMRRLQEKGVCSFGLAGYLHLYSDVLDQRSPLYNFATLHILGPLEFEAARELATVPLERLGVRYAEAELPQLVVERTGGYPYFVQLVCSAMLQELSRGDLVLTTKHLERAEHNDVVRGEGDRFRKSISPASQLVAYGLLDSNDFSRDDALQAWAAAAGTSRPSVNLERVLVELRLSGVVSEAGDRYRWSVPLLRDTLRTQDSAFFLRRLADELPADPAHWYELPPLGS